MLVRNRHPLWLVAGLLFVLFLPMRAQAGAVVHLAGWRWNDVMTNMEAIKRAGYTAILLSPHTATCGNDFSAGYDPSDFDKFHSRFGTEHDLFWLVGTAHWHGIQVYADMVFNHMCAGKYEYTRFRWEDFHHNGGINNWDDEWELENKDLFGLADLAHESPYVRGELYNYLVKTNNLGFDGYRLDAAKHVPLWYWRDHIVNNINAWGKYVVGEVFSANLDVLDRYAAAGMSVTDFNLYDTILRNFRFGGNLAELDGAGYAARNGGRAMTFVENHDVGPPPNRMLAYAFLSAYPGYPIYSNVDIHDSKMNTLVWVQNNKAHGAYINRWKEKEVFIFERQGNLLAGINQSGSWQQRWVQTSWRNTKLHDHTGHSQGEWTNGDGWVSVNIPPMSYVMLSP